MTQHTPGPCTNNRHGTDCDGTGPNCRGSLVMGHTPGRSIVEIIAEGLDECVDGKGWGREHQRAADLADAAPELLEALVELLAVDDIDPRVWSDGCVAAWRYSFAMAKTRAAIRKAMGGA